MSHLFLIKGSGCGTARSSQGRVGFARRSGPLTARTVLQDLRGGKGGRSVVLLLRSREQASLPPILQSVTLPTDVDGGRVVQQTIQDRSGDDRVAKD